MPLSQPATNFYHGNLSASQNTTNIGYGENVLINTIFGAFSNVAFGVNSGMNITTGNANTLFGDGAGVSLTTGTNNVAIGTAALANPVNSNDNIAIGVNAMNTVTSAASANVAIGQQALFMCRGFGNIAVGSFNSNALTTGGGNIVIGQASGGALTVQNFNILIGHQNALSLTGSGNIILGTGGGGTMNNASNNIFIGNNSVPLTNVDTNAIIIGSNGISKGTNTTVIGNLNTTQTFLFGALNIQSFTTALAPASVDGRMYYDTTLAKLRIGVGAVYQTITSA